MNAILTLIFTLFAGVLMAKNIGSIVADASTRQSIPYAHIQVDGRGTAANIDGHWMLAQKELKLISVIKISALGYEAVELELKALSDTVFLRAALNTITETEVRVKTAKEVVQNALAVQFKNYGTGASMSQGFYRINSSTEDAPFIASEAVFKNYQNRDPDAKRPESTVGLVKVRQARNDSAFHQANSVNIGVSAERIMEIDHVLYHKKSEIFSKHCMNAHEWFFLPTDYLLGKQMIVVGFKPKDDEKLGQFEGKVYINIEDDAIARIEYERDAYKIVDYKPVTDFVARIAMSMVGLNIYANYDKYLANYVQQDGVWRLNDVHLEAQYRMYFYRVSEKEILTASMDLVFTETDHEGVAAIPYEMVIKGGELIERYASDDDPKFWEGYDYLPATQPWDDIVAAMPKSIRKAKKARK